MKKLGHGYATIAPKKEEFLSRASIERHQLELLSMHNCEGHIGARDLRSKGIEIGRDVARKDIN